MNNNFVPRWKLRLRRRRKKRLIRLLLFFLIFAVIIFILLQFKTVKNEPVEVKTPAVAGVRDEQTDRSSLKAVVENSLLETKGNYGVVIKNLKTGESYLINEHRVFDAASLYKLWVMAAVYNQIQSGKLNPDQVLSEDIAVLNKDFFIEPDKAELTDGAVTLTVDSALTQMITISHNYAALLLTKQIRLAKVEAFLKENGFKESKVGTSGALPKVTPFDIALFLEKLYKSELADQENSQKMIELLKNQKISDGLPDYLPDKQSSEPVAVAHKTGDIEGFKHDAGIVFTGKGDYIVVIMSESTSPAGAGERIALLSKAVFDYFNKK
ncbi:hypothetical protein A3J19_01550 [Candidatus Daviesbacteria bacterium RIFCSPLOWO2_02_FULL_41_8]|nr:MAG: hypothetical protein A3J19_01550 [Candidatus Daviesbacteria bacterium RIFCSPLOWO2_02_FULL_41_8]